MEILLGKRLKELREEKGLTQREVAEKLGLHSVTYLHYEKKSTSTAVGNISRFCGVFPSFHRLFTRTFRRILILIV